MEHQKADAAQKQTGSQHKKSGGVFGIVLSAWFSVQEADEAFAGD